MLSKTRGTPVRSSARQKVRDGITDPASNGSLTTGRVPTQPAMSGHGRPGSARGSATVERDERRHQRVTARERNGRARERNGRSSRAKTGERLQQGKAQPTGRSPRTRLVLGKTVPVALIAIIVIGLIAGAILGAASVPGWVIGLLVATLTVILSAVRHRFARIR
jgi:hypothetical protein